MVEVVDSMGRQRRIRRQCQLINSSTKKQKQKNIRKLSREKAKMGVRFVVHWSRKQFGLKIQFKGTVYNIPELASRIV